MDIVVTNSELFRRHEPWEGKNLLLDLTVVNSCALLNCEKEVREPGAVITAAVKRKTNKNRDMIPIT